MGLPPRNLFYSKITILWANAVLRNIFLQRVLLLFSALLVFSYLRLSIIIVSIKSKIMLIENSRLNAEFYIFIYVILRVVFLFMF